MSKATTGLRRAGIGGLAAVVAAGTALVGAGSAFAWSAMPTVSATAASPTTVYPGSSAAALGDATIEFNNVWQIGDTITVQLPNTNNCTTTANTLGYSSTPSATAAWKTGTTPNSASVLPTFTVTTSSSAGACTTAGVKDIATITLTNASAGTATGDTVDLTFKASANIGSGIGSDVQEKATFGGPNAPAATLPVAYTVGTLSNLKVSAGTPSVLAPTGSQAINTITATEVKAGTLTDPVTVTFANVTAVDTTGASATWSAETSGSTPTVAPAVQTGTKAAVVVTISGTSATPGTFTLSGIKVTPAAAGDVTATVDATNVLPTGGVSAKVAVVVDITRVGGMDRYATAAALFGKFVTAKGDAGVTSAVIASGENFPDALSAEAMARSLGTSVLLTATNSLPAATIQALANASNVASVYIVGGPGAVSSAVQTQLEGLHKGGASGNPNLAVYRVYGSDRYATNAAVASFVGTMTTAVIATGTNFADALSVGPAVYGTAGFGLVLTNPSSLSASAQQTLINLGVKHVVIVGGTGAVSTNVESQIKALGITVDYRVAGADRTQTAAQIATWETAGLPATATYTPKLNSLGFSVSTVHIARGDDFADALAAGPLAGFGMNPILLTLNPTTLGSGAASFLSGQTAGSVATLNALGLFGAVSTPVMNAAAASLA